MLRYYTATYKIYSKVEVLDRNVPKMSVMNVWWESFRRYEDKTTNIILEIQSEWDSRTVQAPKEWIHKGSQDKSQEWTWLGHRHITRTHTGSQAYHKNTYRFRGILQKYTEVHKHIKEHTQVHRHITKTHAGSQAYHMNTHRFTDVSQEHTQVQGYIARTHTGSQAYHKNTHRFTGISQEHTGSQAHHKNAHRFTVVSQEHKQVYRHITRTHTGSQMCHKNGHTDLGLSKLMIHKWGYIWNLRDTATEGNREAAQSE